MIDQPLPAVPVPAPPLSPACEWCGERPAEPYEIAPEQWGVEHQRASNGTTVQKRVLKKAATMAYACKRHRETFDKRKAETVERKRQEAEARKMAKRRPNG